EFLGENARLGLFPGMPLVGLDAQELLLVVPFVQRLGLIQALVALQPQQPGSGQGGSGLREFRLADPGRTLEQQRFFQAVGQVKDVADQVVGDIPQPFPDGSDVAQTVAHQAYQSGTGASTLTHTDLRVVYSSIAAKPISLPYPERPVPPNGEPGFTRL